MLPEKFCERMKNTLGEEYDAFEKSLEGERHHALRLNALKVNEDGLNATEVLANHEFCKEKVEWAKNGYYYDNSSAPGKHPYHDAGLYYIQEPSAMAPVGELEVAPGEFILDLCAAPGGKTTQIAALMKGEGVLVANEPMPQRAKILSENIERMGIRNAIVTNEMPNRLAEVFPMYFDKILVDAPCSGEGMFRKNEEALVEWSLENVKMCAERQDEILDQAAKMLQPGGRIVYSTCTFSEDEDEGSVERFLSRHSEFELKTMRRLWPHKIKGEGHFLAVLEKEGERSEGIIPKAVTGTVKGIADKELVGYRDFEKNNLCIKLKGDFVKFGDNLYLAPEHAPGIKGLKVLRYGLQLGEDKKNRFEPSHALALALSPKEVKYHCNVSVEDGSAGSFQNGLTFNYEGEKGWYLVCVDGFSTGWGKLAGGIMKNHYPKGLRKY